MRRTQPDIAKEDPHREPLEIKDMAIEGVRNWTWPTGWAWMFHCPSDIPGCNTGWPAPQFRLVIIRAEDQWNPVCLDFWPPKLYNNKRLLFYDVKFMMICYHNHRKLVHPPKQIVLSLRSTCKKMFPPYTKIYHSVPCSSRPDSIACS